MGAMKNDDNFKPAKFQKNLNWKHKNAANPLLEGEIADQGCALTGSCIEECKTMAAAKQLEFKGIGEYTTKGCYTYKSGKYKGTVWFGTGGSEQERVERLF